jgi:hypothetical protein
LHVELTSGDAPGALRLTGLPRGAATALAGGDPNRLARRVIVATDDAVTRARAGRGVLGIEGSLPVVAGRFEADGDALRFVPRFPFLPGTAYRVLVHRSVGGVATTSFEVDDYQLLTFAVPAPPATATTRVVAVHPTAPVVPRNLLRLYVTFSAPMSEGEVAGHVTVRRAGTGAPIADAFLPMEPELWDPERRRVTVLFDPARIKRGLVPHESIGYPLVEGETVEVVVAAGFRDGDGNPLVAPATRRYVVGPDVRRPVDPDGWDVAAPAAGTRSPLAVTFDRPLDHALVARCLAVRDPVGRPVAGAAAVGSGEAGWSFTPDAAWVAGAHTLAVDPVLEDLAGNSVVRVFDRELARPDHRPAPATTSVRPFTVTPDDGT